MNRRKVFRTAVCQLMLLTVVTIVSADETKPITAADTRSVAEIRADLRMKGVVQPDNSRVHYRLPDQDKVRVAIVPYHERWGELAVYYPPDYSFTEPLPAVVMMPGVDNNSIKRRMGLYWREWDRANDWASLFACVGLAVVTYDPGQPYFSAKDAMGFLEQESANLHIDTDRLGVFAISAQTEIAMKILSKSDIPCVSGVKAMAAYYGSSFPGILAYPIDVFLVAAGKAPGDSAKRTEGFAKFAQNQGSTVTFVNYQQGAVLFDTTQDNPQTVEIIQDTLTFFVDLLLDAENPKE